MDNWVDVRKKQIREAINPTITIRKINKLNCYFTIKEINDIDENNDLILSNPELRKIEKNYKMLEYTPINEKYNVRVYVNDRNQVFEYYLDITDGMEIRDGVPFYKDMYLDIIYKKSKKGIKADDEIHILDEDELEEALRNNYITLEQYNSAHEVAKKLIEQIRQGTNIYINRGIEDYINAKEEEER